MHIGRRWCHLRRPTKIDERRAWQLDKFSERHAQRSEGLEILNVSFLLTILNIGATIFLTEQQQNRVHLSSRRRQSFVRAQRLWFLNKHLSFLLTILFYYLLLFVYYEYLRLFG